MPKNDPEYERGFTDGFNSAEKDREELRALRIAAKALIRSTQFALSTPGLIRGRDQLKNAMEATSIALNPED